MFNFINCILWSYRVTWLLTFHLFMLWIIFKRYSYVKSNLHSEDSIKSYLHLVYYSFVCLRIFIAVFLKELAVNFSHVALVWVFESRFYENHEMNFRLFPLSHFLRILCKIESYLFFKCLVESICKITCTLSFFCG